jgi:hypothetical protein
MLRPYKIPGSIPLPYGFPEFYISCPYRIANVAKSSGLAKLALLYFVEAKKL